jgi:hypothetical protein
VQTRPLEQVVPPQQMSPLPPQVRQRPLALHDSPESQTWLVQQRSPGPPQGVRQIPFALQTRPELQVLSGQQRWPAAPHT